MSKKKFNFSIEPWSVIRENKEYSTPIFNLFKRKMRLQTTDDFSEGDFYVLDAPEWINIIAQTDGEQVILVEQYRYGIEAPTLEIPGGMVDEGESPLAAARRELQEETGYVSEQWTGLGKVSANPAIMTNYTHLFWAEGCIYEGAPKLDTHERIHVHLLDEDIFLKRIEDGTIHHSIVVAAVAKWLLSR